MMMMMMIALTFAMDIWLGIINGNSSLIFSMLILLSLSSFSLNSMDGVEVWKVSERASTSFTQNSCWLACISDCCWIF